MKLQFIVFGLLFIQCAYAHDILFGDYNPELFDKEARVPIVANADNSGYLTYVRIGLLNNGKGRIIFDIDNRLDASTIDSIYNAVSQFGDYEHDFMVSYEINANKISGKSSGASVSLGIDSVLRNWTYDPEFIVSGNFEDGKLLETGGLSSKIPACTNRTMIIAEGQTEYVYEKNGNTIIARRVDLMKIADDNNVNFIEATDFRAISNLVTTKGLN